MRCESINSFNYKFLSESVDPSDPSASFGSPEVAEAKESTPFTGQTNAPDQKPSTNSSPQKTSSLSPAPKSMEAERVPIIPVGEEYKETKEEAAARIRQFEVPISEVIALVIVAWFLLKVWAEAVWVPSFSKA